MAKIAFEQSFPPQDAQMFFYMDKNNKGHWFLEDPADPGKHAEFNLENEIVNALDSKGSRSNPIIAKMRIGLMQRSEPFNISLPGKIRKGEMNRHFVDGEGYCVDVLEVCNPDGAYPFNGVVLDSAGNVLEVRKYNGTGGCADGNPDHTIEAFDGVLEIKAPAPASKKAGKKDNPGK